LARRALEATAADASGVLLAAPHQRAFAVSSGGMSIGLAVAQ